MVFFASDIAAALVLKVISDTAAPRKIQFILVPLGMLCALPLALFTLWPAIHQTMNSYVVLPLALWASSGIAVAVICASWSYFLKPSTYHTNLCNSATPFIVSGLAFVIMQLLDPSAAAALTIGLPLGSAVLWYFCHFNEKGKVGKPEDIDLLIHGSYENSVKDVLGLSAANFALFTLATGSIIGFTGALGTMGVYSNWVFLFIGISHIVAGLATYTLLSQVTIYPPKWFFVILLPLAALCLYITSIAPALPLVITCLFALFVLSAAYHIIEQVFTSKFDIDRTRLAYSYFSRDRIINTSGMLIGWAVFTLDAFGPLAHLVDSFFLISILLFIGFFFIASPLATEQKTGIGVNEDEQPELYAFALNTIFEEYEISKREQDIYLLLLQGKKRQDIHEELGISMNTVRSHIYNVYRKLGVHSQQELINLTENAIRAKI